MFANKKYKYLFILFAFFAQGLQANTPLVDSANAAYAKNSFTEAIKLYTSILKSNQSAAIYYNLGNAYYKSNNMAFAILNYERAKKINPNDEDINFNLKLVKLFYHLYLNVI